MASLAAKVWSQITATYDASTKVAASASVSAQASASATVTGTLKSVDAAAGTVTITAQGGAGIVLKVSSSTQVLVNGAASSTTAIASSIGRIKYRRTGDS